MLRRSIRSTLEHFPSIALFLRTIRDVMDQRGRPQKTPWGFTLAGHDAMAAGTFEPEETRLVREILKNVDIFVNVGANIGYYCCHALSLGRPVRAVEPIGRNLHYLLRNIRDNGWEKQAEVFPVAAGCRADILQMWGGGTGASLVKGWASIPESYVTLVPVMTLDRLLGSNLPGLRALIVVDIEGAEWMMLQGAMTILENRPRPTWMVEISAAAHQPGGSGFNPRFQATFDMFFDRGYRAYAADASGREVTKANVEQILAGQLRLSGHNFVFRE